MKKFDYCEAAGIEVKQCQLENVNVNYVNAEAVENFLTDYMNRTPSLMISKREKIALALFQGYLSSGRREAWIEGVNMPAESAAFIMADRFIAESLKGQK
jgi:hypothetical protein